jgi:hypothetical protein
MRALVLAMLALSCGPSLESEAEPGAVESLPKGRECLPPGTITTSQSCFSCPDHDCCRCGGRMLVAVPDGGWAT